MKNCLPAFKNIFGGTCILVIAVVFSMWGDALANGEALSQSTEQYEIQFAYSPLSPLTGENVNMSFVILDKETHEPAAGVIIGFVIIETNPDATLDRRIHETTKKSDERGVINYPFVFPNDAVYTILLSVQNPDAPRGREEAEFYIQAREGKGSGEVSSGPPIEKVQIVPEDPVPPAKSDWLLQIQLVLAGLIGGSLLTVAIQKIISRH